MSGLVVRSAVVPGTPPATEAVVVNDGWFPNIDPVRLRAEHRIRDSVTPERLRGAIVGAIITVGNQLAVWQANQMTAAHASLAAVPALQIDGKSRFVLLYARAIGAYVKAELVEGYRDTDATSAGQREVTDLEPSIGELRRDAIHAIRDILGRPRMRAELI